MKLLSSLLIFTYALTASAENLVPERSSTAAQSFCASRFSDDKAIQSHVTSSSNQLSFMNRGGLFGGGVCWWHSRFTRAAAYLAVFDPSLPKPSPEEAKKIIHRLRSRKGVTLIPGYRDLHQFSLRHREEIQAKLNDWQKADGVFKASWIQGLSGSTESDPEELSRSMDDLFERVSRGEVVYQMLQMPGVVAHAWLVTGMKKTSDGYNLTVIDSNVGTTSYVYRYGMTSFNYLGWYKFVPYTHQTAEEEKLGRKMRAFCERGSDEEDLD